MALSLETPQQHYYVDQAIELIKHYLKSPESAADNSTRESLERIRTELTSPSSHDLLKTVEIGSYDDHQLAHLSKQLADYGSQLKCQSNNLQISFDSHKLKSTEDLLNSNEKDDIVLLCINLNSSIELLPCQSVVPLPISDESIIFDVLTLTAVNRVIVRLHETQVDSWDYIIDELIETNEAPKDAKSPESQFWLIIQDIAKDFEIEQNHLMKCVQRRATLYDEVEKNSGYVKQLNEYAWQKSEGKGNLSLPELLKTIKLENTPCNQRLLESYIKDVANDVQVRSKRKILWIY